MSTVFPPLNRQPRGILSLFGISSGGRPPQRLSFELLPQLDLLKWYVASDAQDLTIDGSLTAVGFMAAGFTVPQDEFWVVQALSMQSIAALGAGVTVRARAAYRRNVPAVSAPYAVFPTEPFSLVTGEVWYSGGDIPNLLYLPPGTVTGAFVSTLAAGPVNVRSFARVARLRL